MPGDCYSCTRGNCHGCDSNMEAFARSAGQNCTSYINKHCGDIHYCENCIAKDTCRLYHNIQKGQLVAPPSNFYD